VPLRSLRTNETFCRILRGGATTKPTNPTTPADRRTFAGVTRGVEPPRLNKKAAAPTISKLVMVTTASGRIPRRTHSLPRTRVDGASLRTQTRARLADRHGAQGPAGEETHPPVQGGANSLTEDRRQRASRDPVAGDAGCRRVSSLTRPAVSRSLYVSLVTHRSRAACSTTSRFGACPYRRGSWPGCRRRTSSTKFRPGCAIGRRKPNRTSQRRDTP